LPIFFFTSCEKEGTKSGTTIRKVLKMDYQLSTKADTKVTTTQPVSGSNVYSFYSYKTSIIKGQTVTTTQRTFEVPEHDSKYDMLFLSMGLNSTNPNVIASSRITMDTKSTEKNIKFTAKFNENWCYKTFTRGEMTAAGDPITLTLMPLFSQIELIAPNKSNNNEPIKIKEIKLLTGAQQTADVTIKKQSSGGLAEVPYLKQADYPYTFQITETATSWNFVNRYYNLIPNGKNFTISVSVEFRGKTITQTLPAKKTMQLQRGTRYKLELNVDASGLSFKIDPYKENQLEGWLDETLPSITY
jgi:hypothetical protein